MISFNRPYLTGNELSNIRQAHRKAQFAGDGYFTRKCQHWLEKNLGTKKAFLTHSCTSALEMAAILADIKPGDEVIMPSYTFVSTANAFVLRGGVPVFVDIRTDTLNIDENLIEKAITRKTKIIVPVHYAGVSCEMDIILKIAKKHRLLVIEDAAHGVRATYKGRELGTIGDLGALSFHETKNIISGEGGALLVNNPKFIKRAEIVWQKGTDRSNFNRREVDKYSWKDIGSSYPPSEIVSAFLNAQLEKSKKITKKRKNIWDKYHKSLENLEKKRKLRRPITPSGSTHNAHIYYILLKTLKSRDKLLKVAKKNSVNLVFHYFPLHKSKMARKLKLKTKNLFKSEKISNTIVRLPIFVGLKDREQQKILSLIKVVLNKL